MSQQQSIVSVYRLQALARALLPRERVASCCRAMVPGAPFVDVLRLPQHAAARYRNLIRCASYWTCPVCARKIGARRAVELAALLDAHEAAGGVAAMLTLTLRHRRGQPLAALLSSLLQAWRWMTAHRQYKTLRLIGSVRALEITYSPAAGWHPHLHILLLLPAMPRPLRRRALSSLWLAALERHGADGLAGVACHVRPVDARHVAGQYVAKAGAVYELTAAHNKRRSLTPWALLERAATDRSSEDARLWYEYVAATRGRSSLQFSRGLRAAVASDQQLVDRDDDALSILLTRLPPAAWDRVCAAEVRGVLLQYAADANVDAIAALLAAIGIDPDLLMWYDGADDGADGESGVCDDDGEACCVGV